MKIDNNPSVVNIDAYIKKHDDKISSGGTSPTADNPSGENVNFSSRAKEIVRIQRVLETTRNLEPMKTEEIRHRIEENSYQVSPEDVAEKMIRENIIDLIV